MKAIGVATAVAILGSFVVGGCGDDSTTLRVMAASSLTGAFAEIESTFEDANPGVDVVVIGASSSALAAQIVDGAEIDVFASADQAQFSRAADVVDFDAPRTLATNSLVIIVPPGNPRDVRGLGDLARDDVLVATAADDVPIRKYTDRLLEAAGVTAHFITFEANVAGIVTKVSTGAADAGVVYVSDLFGADVDSVTIPVEQNLIASYPIAAAADSDRSTIARRFVDFALSTDGRAILVSYGFTAP
ncbi:MAG: molybdate ABC transporter substrate-binding protein [Acidimicrobiia bacterium]